MSKILLTLILAIVSFPLHAAEIIAARYTQETERYDHCVLGDCREYGAVEAILDNGQVVTFQLDENSVFEDVAPRLVPLGLNGRNAVLTVRTYLDKGAALAVLDLKGEALEIVAESEPIGEAHRWQNPIGVGNFDRDGKLEVASVLTPHIGGRLMIYERQGNKLVVDKSAYPFSNHQIHSRELDLHEILDWDGDKVQDIVVPGVTRHRLNVISFAEGEARVLAERSFDKLIAGPVTLSEGGLKIVFDDGSEEYWAVPVQ